MLYPREHPKSNKLYQKVIIYKYKYNYKYKYKYSVSVVKKVSLLIVVTLGNQSCEKLQDNRSDNGVVSLSQSVISPGDILLCKQSNQILLMFGVNDSCKDSRRT